MRRKGGIFLSMFVMLAIYLFAVALVIVFFYFFKFHISITIIDEYRWNKVQEVPLSLLSMDIGGESFVSKMNKVYYEKEDATQLRNQLRDIITKQLFYGYGAEYPFEYFINIGGNISLSAKDCACEGPWHARFTGEYRCNAQCGSKYKDEKCAAPVGWKIFVYTPSNKKCYGPNVVTYKALYPFPLTFNGTGEFTSFISYEILEWRD